MLEAKKRLAGISPEKKKTYKSFRFSLGERKLKKSSPRGFHVHLLSLPLQIRMHQRNMVITTNDISQRTQSLLYPLNLDLIGQGVSQMLQFLVGSRCRNQQTILVSNDQTAHDTGSGNGGVADGDDVLEFGLEDGVEVLRGADSDDGVGVC